MRAAACFLAIALAVAGCTAADPASAPAASPARTAPASEPGALQPSEPFAVTTITLADPDGGTALPIQVYDAYTPDMRRLGLMHRKELPPNAGMIFRYPQDSAGGFWMRNTLIPLSIAYYDADGIVHTVLDMEPCTTPRCPSYPPQSPYRGALEVNQGFFDEIGLEPGWRVEVPFGLPPAQA